MSNISTVSGNFFTRLFSSRKIPENDKQDTLNQCCKDESELSYKFFEDFNSLLTLKNKVVEQESNVNNKNKGNIAKLIQSQGYDKGITASATLAIVYNLINISSKLPLSNSILTVNKGRNQIDTVKLKCYLNLFMNLSSSNISVIEKYVCQINKNFNDTNKDKLILNDYTVSMPKQDINNSKSALLLEDNENKPNNTNSKSGLLLEDNENKPNNTQSIKFNNLNSNSNIIKQIYNNSNTKKLMMANKEEFNIYNNIIQQIYNNSNTKKLMMANKEEFNIYNNIITDVADGGSKRNLGEKLDDENNEDNERKTIKSQVDILRKLIGAHDKNLESKSKNHNSSDDKKSEGKECKHYAKCKIRAEAIKASTENNIKEGVDISGSDTTKVVYTSGSDTIKYCSSMPSMWNKLPDSIKESMIGKNKDIEKFLINTYQLNYQDNNTSKVLKTYTGTLFDSNIARNEAKAEEIFKLALGVTSLEGYKNNNLKMPVVVDIRLLDSICDRKKFERHKAAMEAVAKKYGILYIPVQVHFSAGWYEDKMSLTNGTQARSADENQAFKLLKNNVDAAKLKLQEHDKTTTRYPDKIYELLTKQNLTASEFLLFDALCTVLHKKIENPILKEILACKSGKDRTAAEIVAMRALESILSTNSDNIDLDALVANNKINIRELEKEQVETFINNFDDKLFYLINEYDNGIITNQNANTVLRVLGDFAYHPKFKQPYKKVTNGS